MIFIQFYLILMREPEYLPEKNCFAFPSLLLSQFMSSSGMAIFFFFTLLIICLHLFMHTRVLVRMESNAFRLKTFFFIDKVTASNGKLIFGVNFTYNTTGFETMYVLKVWHSSRLYC